MRERALESPEQMAKIADQYLEAHGKHVFSPGRNKPPTPPEKDDNNRPLTDATLYFYRVMAAEDIGLLIVLLGNAMCVEGIAMKQETVNPVCQSQEGKTRKVPLYRETRSVPGF